ncbi:MULTISPECIES: hypothetical protein [Cryobacterium]|uniref:Uncharacterized protein n=1 Tax=Cryobacterium breve TaxID=1259258 RepID=A0ABY2IWH1_9MICO|nr:MULTISPECIES: hypothetical protein [Cryobacterium]TFC94745.1 hypothetical protein E3T20_07165 [Cryobacterium sp. TmT3-12]TFC96365.1 hypothetical protein E3O65_13445 [Cryobacterium breve]
MNEYRLTVNGDRYVVDTDDDLAAWKTSVADAVRAGGGFINVTNSTGFLTTLLITPNSTVTLQRVRPPRPEPWPQLLADEAFTYEDF